MLLLSKWLKDRPIFLILFSWLLISGCGLQTPALSFKSLLFSAGATSEKRIVIPNTIPEGFAPTKLSSEEKESVKNAISFFSADGFLTEEILSMQVKGLTNLKSFMQSDAYTDSVSLMGPIPGFQPGMTFREYSDFFISEMSTAAVNYPTEVLPMLRNQITVSIALLQKMKSKCGVDDTETCDDLDYISNKYLMLREAVIEEYKLRIINQLQENL